MRTSPQTGGFQVKDNSDYTQIISLPCSDAVTSLLDSGHVQARQEAAEDEARAEGVRHHPAVQGGGDQPRQAALRRLQFMMDM